MNKKEVIIVAVTITILLLFWVLGSLAFAYSKGGTS